MPLPHLHLYHPPESVASYLLEWLGEVEETLRRDATWDGCQFSRVAYDSQAGFNAGTEIDRIRRNAGPAIFIQKVQAKLLKRFRDALQREISVYSIAPASAQDIVNACQEARRAYEDGEPRLPDRELIAYLIIAKLARQDKWGGTSLNKNFLWGSDLPKGGFPKDILDDRGILQVADALYNAGVLTGKKSNGKMKYALGDKALIQPILDSKSFENAPKLQKYFGKSRNHVSARLLDYNE